MHFKNRSPGHRWSMAYVSLWVDNCQTSCSHGINWVPPPPPFVTVTNSGASPNRPMLFYWVQIGLIWRPRAVILFLGLQESCRAGIRFWRRSSWDRHVAAVSQQRSVVQLGWLGHGPDWFCHWRRWLPTPRPCHCSVCCRTFITTSKHVIFHREDGAKILTHR